MKIKCEMVAQKSYRIISPHCCMRMTSFLENSPNSFNDRTGNISVYTDLYANRRYRFNVNFCPFCGTEIIKNEPILGDKNEKM